MTSGCPLLHLSQSSACAHAPLRWLDIRIQGMHLDQGTSLWKGFMPAGPTACLEMWQLEKASRRSWKPRRQQHQDQKTRTVSASWSNPITTIKSKVDLERQTVGRSYSSLSTIQGASLQSGQDTFWNQTNITPRRNCIHPPFPPPISGHKAFLGGGGGGWVRFWRTAQISDPKSIPKVDQIRDPEKTLLNEKGEKLERKTKDLM